MGEGLLPAIREMKLMWIERLCGSVYQIKDMNDKAELLPWKMQSRYLLIEIQPEQHSFINIVNVSNLNGIIYDMANKVCLSLPWPG